MHKITDFAFMVNRRTSVYNAMIADSDVRLYYCPLHHYSPLADFGRLGHYGIFMNRAGIFGLIAFGYLSP